MTHKFTNKFESEFARFMRLQWIWERTKFEYVDKLSEKRRSEYLNLAERCKKEMKKISPLYGTPLYGFNPRAYYELMREEWLSRG